MVVSMPTGGKSATLRHALDVAGELCPPPVDHIQWALMASYSSAVASHSPPNPGTPLKPSAGERTGWWDCCSVRGRVGPSVTAMSFVGYPLHYRKMKEGGTSASTHNPAAGRSISLRYVNLGKGNAM